MHRFPVSSGCAECEKLLARYEQTLAMRLQAEADLLTAMRSQNPVAVGSARRTIDGVILQWTRADGALRSHQRTHDFLVAA